jgi:magnesium-transporting ATPase (P-type)
MSKTAEQKAEMKQKAKHEMKELIVIFLYLAFFFCALTTYNMVLLREFHEETWNYGFALLNALVITKVVMIGEVAKVGSRYEARPLLLSALYKAFMFWLLVLAFHFVEELIKRLWHGADLATASREIRIDDLISRSIIIFCVFIPFFGFREFQRVLGEEKFYNLLFRSEAEGR